MEFGRRIGQNLGWNDKLWVENWIVFSLLELLNYLNNERIKVERSVTQPPPHRSRRAVLPHRALQICSLTHWQALNKEFQLLMFTWVLFSNFRSRYQKLLQQVSESGPIVTQLLAAPVEPFKQNAYTPVIECLQTIVITDNTIIVPVPAVLGPKGCH